MLPDLVQKSEAYRREHQLSQRQMAKLIGVSQGHYSNLLKQSRRLTPAVARRIRAALKNPKTQVIVQEVIKEVPAIHNCWWCRLKAFLAT